MPTRQGINDDFKDMQRLIITDNNNAHTGKTTALRGVYELLKEKGYEHKDIAGPGMGPNWDVKAIFTINGIKVGIETIGDNKSCNVHQESLDDFLHEDCKIIMTASRLRGATRTNVREFYRNNGFVSVWMKHDYTQNVKLQPILNRRYAERVVQFVEEWLCGAYQPC